jgi:hypothetical protein
MLAFSSDQSSVTTKFLASALLVFLPVMNALNPLILTRFFAAFLITAILASPGLASAASCTTMVGGIEPPARELSAKIQTNPIVETASSTPVIEQAPDQKLTQQQERIEKALLILLPSLSSGKSTPMHLTQFVLQKTHEEVEKISRFNRDTSIPELDTANTVAKKANGEIQAFLETLNRIDSSTKKSKRFLSRIWPWKKNKSAKKNAAALRGKLETVEAFKKEIETESAILDQYYVEVKQKYEDLSSEIDFLNALVDRLGTEIFNLNETANARYQLQTDVIPALVDTVMNMRSLQAVMSVTVEGLKTRIRLNEAVLNEARNLTQAVLPAAIANNPKLKALLEAKTAPNETEAQTFCITGDLCTGQLIITAKRGFGKILGVFPDGTYSIDFSHLAGTYKISRDEIGITDPIRFEIYGNSYQVGQKIITKEKGYGKIKGVLPNGTVIIDFNNFARFHPFDVSDLHVISGKLDDLSVSSRVYHERYGKGEIVGINPYRNTYIIDFSSYSGYHVMHRSDLAAEKSSK